MSWQKDVAAGVYTHGSLGTDPQFLLYPTNKHYSIAVVMLRKQLPLPPKYFAPQNCGWQRPHVAVR